MQRDPHFRNTGSNQFREGVQSRWDKATRSRGFTVACLLLLIAVSGVVWLAHIRGRIHQLTTAQAAPEHDIPTARPGNQDLVHLSRMQLTGSMTPEFTAATLVPGDGMLLLQTLLSLPGKGDVPILLGSRESDLAGEATNLSGADFSALVSHHDGAKSSRPLELIAGRAAMQQETAILPGGTRSDATFSPDVSGGDGAVIHTGVTSKVSVSLTNRGLELALSAKNVSNETRAVTLLWRPAFLVPSTGMGSMVLVPPRADPACGGARRRSAVRCARL